MTITGKHDVYEFLVDGQSGLIPGDVSGKAVLAGVCSRGEVGRAYRLGAQSPVRAILGSGPLADAVEDAFAGAAAAGGQNSILIAVPVAGAPGGVIGELRHSGPGPKPVVTGYPAANADILIRVITGGLPGAAVVTVSTSDGAISGALENLPAQAVPEETLPADGRISVPEAGVTFSFDPAEELVAGAEYRCSVRLPVEPVRQTGPGPAIACSGTVLAGAQVQLLITRSGKLNEGQYQLSLDGGDLFGTIRTLPADGIIAAGDTGAALTLDPAIRYEAGTLYAVDLLPPVPTISAVIEALELPLERLDPEIVHIVGPTDAVDWAALSMLARERFQGHRPTMFTCETRLPRDGEDLNAWADSLLDQRAAGAAPFVACCAAFGEILDRAGLRRARSAGGLLIGRLISIPVQRHIGRVADGPITPLILPNGWNDALQVDLRDAGFITAQWYEGLNGAYWGEDRLLAEDVSDYRFLTVLRVIFKALRLMRIQALKSMFDEAGDPLLENGAAGLNYLRNNLEASLEVMTTARPKELAAGVVEIPGGQDIVNNGVDCEVTLIGIPIIKRISIHAKYVYAGGRFDPRLAQ